MCSALTSLKEKSGLNVANTSYFFDVLPAHPAPEKLESLTSYFMRIAQANNIHIVKALSTLIGVNADILKSLTDHPLRTFGKTAERLACLDSQILATTFFHIGRKFGRLAYSNALSGFLRGSLGSSLRYCPSCLADRLCYSLIWRFLSLPGCVTHSCRLLDHCQHCGSPIPLITFPPRIGACPTCGGDLRSCRADVLQEQEILATRAQTADLMYLLSPHQCEEDDDMLKKIGYRFAMLRRERCFPAQTVAECIGSSLQEVMKLEMGNTHQFASFQVYQKYAKYLGVTLQDMFQYWATGDEPTAISPREIPVSLPQTRQLMLHQYEDVVIEHVKEIMTTLKALKGKVTLGDIVKHMQMRPEVLKQYPAFNAIVEQLITNRRDEQMRQPQQYEDGLMRQVKKAVATLKTNGQSLTREAISGLLGISLRRLHYYRRVGYFLRQYPYHERSHL